MNVLSGVRRWATGHSPQIRDPARNIDCSAFEVDNWAVSRFVFGRLVPIIGMHPFPINEQVLMVAAVCRVKPSHILEWGTHIGKSARLFYETCKTFGIEAEIHSTDLPDNVGHAEHPGGRRGELVMGIQGVRLHLGDGLATSLKIMAGTNVKNPRPLFFIDGDHSYASVTRELGCIIEQSPDANILLHDTFFQSAESGYNTGPHAAVAAMMKQQPDRYVVMKQNLGLPGMTFLWRRP